MLTKKNQKFCLELCLGFWIGVAICCFLMVACRSQSGVAELELNVSASVAATNLPQNDLRRSNPVISKYVKEMTPEVQESISGIFLVADESHYGKYRDSSGKDHGVSGHCHRDSRKICLTAETVAKWPSVIDHEATHAYHLRLRAEGSDFDKKWRPGHGITWYACDAQKTTGDFLEDVAEWVQEVKVCARGEYSEFAYHFHWNDARRHNLYLLLEYKFVREAEFLVFLEKNPKATRKP